LFFKHCNISPKSDNGASFGLFSVAQLIIILLSVLYVHLVRNTFIVHNLALKGMKLALCICSQTLLNMIWH